MKNTLTLLTALLLAPLAALHAALPIERSSLVPVELDAAAFSQWHNGSATSISTEQAKNGPASVVWTARTDPSHSGIRFGEGREPGVRHLRIGFAAPVAIGSVLVRGGGTLSVLKADAAYPGDLSDDKQWITASRLKDGAESQAEVGSGSYGLWLLPAGTTTRALRFTHSPAPGDREMSGSLGGVWLHDKRLLNFAPQAIAQSSARDDASAKLIDERHNDWATWDNGERGAEQRIDESHPEIVTLTWPRAITLSGVCLLWNGFGAATFDAFTGPEDTNVRTAPEAQWQRLTEATKLYSLYPFALAPHWIAFGKSVTTRSLRLRITSGAISRHPHLAGKVKDGKRVWLGEFMALTPVANDATLASFVLPKQAEEPPPIPVKFTLPEAGLVTLVIDDKDGRRVRNLVSETPFPAGENIAWWDGSDDLLRDPQAATHGLYHIPTRPVAPGDYTVRGLWRKSLSLRYEFSIYNAGKPAWTTADNTGCWLTTHTPPVSMAFVPGSRTADGQPLIFMGCFVAEGGHGLQWLREDGTKVGGQHWVGGLWTGALTLAVDSGANAVADHLCYVGSVWDGELRLTAKTRDLKDQHIFKTKLGNEASKEQRKKGDASLPPRLESFEGGDRLFVLSGLAVHDGLLVCSMVRQNELLFVDAGSGSITGRLAVNSPRGVTFDAKGRMLVLSGNQLLAFSSVKATKAETIVVTDLDDPRHIALGKEGQFFISDRGAAHQIKVFTSTGKLITTIGKPGTPAVGKYDPQHMNNPNGLALDSQGRVWVAENDQFPRRVSVWTQRGELQRTFYGPSQYGGGGVLDSRDANVFFYKGMEFALDWKNGTDALRRIIARPDRLQAASYGTYSPDYPLYPSGRKGTRYFTSCYTHNPTNGDAVAMIWRDDGAPGAKLVAAAGDAHKWPILHDESFRALWPEGTNPAEEYPKPGKQVFFLWSDTNNDGAPQSNEVQMTMQGGKGITVTSDLALIVSRFGEDTALFSPVSSTPQGVPTYGLKHTRLGPAGGRPGSSGGDQTLFVDGWTMHSNAPEPFSNFGLGGSYKGEPRWSYPSPWPGLHASHEAAVPDRPGQVIGHTRLLGDCIQSKVGPVFGVNGNMGNMYLFTFDGLFVATLFHDIRLRPNWAAPVATRGMDVTDVSLHDENFWPSMTQTPDGKVFLIEGARTSLVRVDGLDTLKRLPEQKITVTTGDLEKARDWFARAELARQKARGTGILTVPLRTDAPTVDGKLEDWPATSDWATIDRRGTKANFNSDSKPYEVSASLCISGDRLFTAWRTTEKDLLNNSGETPNALFKTGGCLDLMLHTDTDQRLLVTLIKGQPRAMLYRSKVPGTTQPVAFSSPWRTIHIDAVEDITTQVTFATDKAGHYEISVPLATLHWTPKANDLVRADIGVLRGANGQTTQRVYWSNKATAITADVPSEAELTPKLWGQWRVQ